MKVDFLKEGSIDCPIIRLYDGQVEDYNKLIDGIYNIITTGKSFDLLKLEGFEHDSSINSFLIELDEENKGVIENPEGVFHCYWSKELLLNIIERFKIYQKTPITSVHYYWLDDDAEGIDILLSYSGRW